MSKIIFNGSIDVSKIDKSKLFKGKKGTYLNLSMVLDPDQLDQYENNGFIAEAVSKEEREAGKKGVILGNAKVVWREEQQAPAFSNPPQSPASSTISVDDFDDDIPWGD